MDILNMDEMIFTEAVKMESIPEMKMVRKQVVLDQGTPIGRGCMCFLYTKDINQSIKMMNNTDNFMSKKHYPLYFYPSIYTGRIYNKKFRFREIEKRHDYCELIDSKVSGCNGYDRAVLSMSEKRSMFIDLHRYLEIFESICGSLPPSKYISYYWTYLKNVLKSYDMYVNYTNRFVIIDLKNFTMTKSLKDNLRNPLYMIFYTMYKNYELLKDVDMDFYFYNGRKVLLINPSHAGEDDYKILRAELRRVSEGLNKSVVDKTDAFTDDDTIKKAENIEEPVSNIINKVYTKDTIDNPGTLLDKSPVNQKVAMPSPDVVNKVTKDVEKASNDVKKAEEKIIKQASSNGQPLNDTTKANTSNTVSKDKETHGENKENINKEVIPPEGAVSNAGEDEINKDEELLSKIYEDLRRTSANQTPTSKRDEILRKQQMEVMVGNTSIKDLEKINAQNVMIETKDVSAKTSGINKNMESITFNQFEKTYNEKLMKKDIVNAITSLNNKSIPLYVVSIEIKDSSDVLNYKDTYRIVLEDEQKKRHTINVDIPKFIEDKFLYINGNRMMIKHQSFFYPVVKVNSDTVHITTNYNKVIITRNDKKSVSAVERFKKLVKNNEEVNKLCTFGNVYNTNVDSVTTIEYDDLSKMISNFKSKNGKTNIFFSQEQAKEEANKKGIKLSDEMLFIGYNNGEPSFINIKTGKDSHDKTIVDIIMDSLPSDINDQFISTKHPKILSFAQCRIMEKMVKCGVLLSFWAGFSELIKKLKVEYRLENKTPRELASNEDYIIFKDCVFIYKTTTTSSLILSGLSDLNTTLINIADMDIKETYAPYILKRFGNSQIENALMNFYEFLIDPITDEILKDMAMPNDVVDLFIYAINLLGDSQYIPEINQGLSRIRSNEIVSAILYERLAKNYVLYRNSNGRKKYSIPQNSVIQEIQAQNTVENYSTLNPFLELQMSHYTSAKGFRGSNMDRAYKTEKRSYDPSMTGTISTISSPDGNVGVNKQLTLEPRIINARGYVNVPKTEKDIDSVKDVNIFSPVELTMPAVSLYDDSTRVGHSVKQSIQCMPVTKSSPVLITNGFDEVARFHLSSDFVVNAKEDGEVIDYDDKSQIMVIKYKSGEIKAVDLSPNIVKNGGGGFYLSNELITKFKVGDKFKKDDVIAAHKNFFTSSSYNNCRLNVGTLAKVALMSSYNTYEDGTFITNKLAKDASTEMVFNKSVVVGKNSNVEYMVQKGNKVLVGDSLIQFDSSFEDDSINALLANMSDSNKEAILENSRNDVKSKVSGTVVDIKIYATVDLEEMSDSLRRICSLYYKSINHKNNFLDKYDPDNKHSVVKCGIFVNEVAGKVKPNQYGVIKGEEVDDGVLIEFYIKHSEPLEVGSKIANFSALKNTIDEIIPEGYEPWSEFRPEEEVSSIIASNSILNRMVPSLYVTVLGYKLVVELKRALKVIYSKNQSREEMMNLIIKFFNAVDKSKSNTNYYKALFEPMSNAEFNRYFKGFFDDENAYLTISIVDYEHNLTMDDVESGAKVLNIPLFEYVSLPHLSMDKSRVITTKHPVPVGYILVKRPQQTVIVPNKIIIFSLLSINPFNCWNILRA